MTECEKMIAVHELSQAIGEFIEWLPTAGLQICEKITHDDCGWRNGRSPALADDRRCVDGRLWDGAVDLDANCQACHGTGRVRLREAQFWPGLGKAGTIEKLLAQHFGIDLVKVDKERRAMLEDLRGRG